MTFWIIAAAMTAVVTAALLAPLWRRPDEVARKHYDAEVYHDQLAEVDRDRAAGLIAGEEAEHARAEIGRRLIRANREKDAEAARGTGSWLRAAARIVVLVTVPAAALGAYLATGNPGVEHQPLASRSMPGTTGAPAELAAMIGAAEDHLAANPDDGRGWEVLAPIYARIGRLEDAETAYRNAIILLGPTAARQGGYGEVLVALAGGVVTEKARFAFESARELEPDDVRSAFYLALALMQEGRNARALQAFRDIAATSPPDAPWLVPVNAQIAALQAEENEASSNVGTIFSPPENETPGAASGPGSAEIAAADAMAPEDRLAMIEGMVEGLDARLRSEPDNIGGWMRLMHSYSVLGRLDEAGDALERALQVFPAESEDGQALVAAARQAGVPAETQPVDPAGQSDSEEEEATP